MAGYLRIIPRDLFNEADLLKCCGRLWIALDETQDHDARFEDETFDSFDIAQDESSGDIHVANLRFTVRGEAYRLSRPLNSRRAWPLQLCAPDPEAVFDPVEVFDGNGALTEEMLSFIARRPVTS